MIDFEYHNPTSLDQVFGLLDRYGEDARVMAGGTALVIQMKQRLAQPSHVVGLRKVGNLNTIESTSEGVRIGALCTQREQLLDPRCLALGTILRLHGQCQFAAYTQFFVEGELGVNAAAQVPMVQQAFRAQLIQL